jgi:hypothetical protein
MKLLDRIALNRLVSIIASLIITLAKIFKESPDSLRPQPKNKPRKKIVKNIWDKLTNPWGS